MKTSTTIYDLYDFALLKVSSSKSMIGPFGQKIAIINNNDLASFASMRSESCDFAVNPEWLEKYAYTIIWEPTQEQMRTVLAQQNKCGKAVVVSHEKLQHYKYQQKNSRAVFAPVLHVNILHEETNQPTHYITVYSLRAVQTKTQTMTHKQLHRSVTRAKFDNVLERDKAENGAFVPICTWNKAVRSTHNVNKRWG